MFLLYQVITFGCLILCCAPSPVLEKIHRLVKRDNDDQILQRIQQVGSLNFNSTLLRNDIEPRRFACFFVFDKEAANDLNNNLRLAQRYADQLASLASRYTAHANIVITNAGTEIWSNGDQISFDSAAQGTNAMPDFLTQFQAYLERTQKNNFGKTYAFGVLLSNKASLGGGFTQGPPCATSGASIMRYRPIPWNIAGLLAHELAHTLSVVHPTDLPYLCQDFPKLPFCKASGIPAECLCSSDEFPREQCLMTFFFGRARPNAPRYTTCDIEMMNFFSPKIACLAP